MIHQRVLSRVIGVSQIALGIGFLFLPDLFFSGFGFSPASGDQKYLFGQLAARFFAYGIGMFIIARNPLKHRAWWDLMILIQLIDLLVGAWGVATGEVLFRVAAFPMFNALLFSLLLILWRPRVATQEAVTD
jgi:hypothetical protein